MLLIPENETERQAALELYEILNTSPDQRYDDIVLLASLLFRTPISTISLIDNNREWFKAKLGVNVESSPRDIAFCAHGILQKDPLVIPDTFHDERFKNNPMVIGEPYIRFYAGAQLINSDGYALGMLCVKDTKPREVSMELINGLQALARRVMSQFEQDRLSRKSLHTMQNRLDLLLQNVPIIFCSFDNDGIIRILEGARLLPKIGIPREKHINHSIYDLFKDRTDITRFINTALTGINTSAQFVFNNVVLDIVCIPEYTESNEWVGVNCVAMDVTDVANKEREISITHKMESIGKLAAGIAHEINSPLQYINGNISFISECFTDLFKAIDCIKSFIDIKQESDPTTAKRLTEILDSNDSDYICTEMPKAIHDTLHGIEQVTNIAQALKYFTHTNTQDKVTNNLVQCIESVVTISRNEWKYVADMDLDLAENIPPIQCNPNELSQVLLNMIINASYAIGEAGLNSKGRIAVSVHKGKGHVEIVVSDNGCGIPESLRKQVFEPYFTTKPQGIGTGQGLAFSRTVIVEHSGGTLTIDETYTTGAKFIITLPYAKVSGSVQNMAA